MCCWDFVSVIFFSGFARNHLSTLLPCFSAVPSYHGLLCVIRVSLLTMYVSPNAAIGSMLIPLSVLHGFPIQADLTRVYHRAIQPYIIFKCPVLFPASSILILFSQYLIHILLVWWSWCTRLDKKKKKFKITLFCDVIVENVCRGHVGTCKFFSFASLMSNKLFRNDVRIFVNESCFAGLTKGNIANHPAQMFGKSFLFRNINHLISIYQARPLINPRG